MGGEYFSAKNIDISLFLCYNYKNNLGRQIMEELLKRLMSYARVAILLIISLILMVCGTIDHLGVLFIIGLVVAIVTAVRVRLDGDLGYCLEQIREDAACGIFCCLPGGVFYAWNESVFFSSAAYISPPPYMTRTIETVRFFSLQL